jgi:hypothetical protein
MNKIVKFTVVAAAVVALGISQANAMTEVWSAQVSSFLTLADGTTGVPSGGKIELGILGTNTVSGLQALALNPAGLDAAFVDWAVNSIGTGTGIDGSWSITTGAPGAGFFSQQIYLLAFNTANSASASQVGLFTNPSWVFPASDAANPGTIELSDAGLLALIGAIGGNTVTTPSELDGGQAIKLAVVPEPSSVVLAGLGLLGLVGLIRRRS